MQDRIGLKQLRSFGFLVGGIFGLLGIWPLLFSRGIRLWAIIPSALLLFLAFVLPKSLGPVYRVWMRLGHVLGSINTKIILAVLYYTMFVPMGFLMRLTGKDPMRRRLDYDAITYREPCKPRPGSHMLRQF